MSAGAAHPLAGRLAPQGLLIDVDGLRRAYADLRPDPAVPAQRVAFGTSGHRGSALRRAFNADHVACMAQALAEHRRRAGIDGPLFVAADTHALSAPALETALEVLAGNGVSLVIDSGDRPIPTPLLSHAVRAWNAARKGGKADGLVITPSHNPPEDGGFKYNPPHGGPAGSAEATAIETRANELLASGLSGVRRLALRAARAGAARHDFVASYADDLGSVLDLPAVAAAGLSLAADPLGGTALSCWEAIAERWGLSLRVLNGRFDPTFGGVPVDRDGKIRMDCSSPWAMAGLLEHRHAYDLCFGNDADADRHGIVTPGAGLLNPNHYLAVAIDYLFSHRPGWSAAAAVGKTLVSSSLIDRVAAARGRAVHEVPVGFKWFVEGLDRGSLGIAGEESAGASFLRRDGRCWTTDKDGLLLCLLAAEITAVTGQDPGERHAALVARHGEATYERIDAPCPPEQKAALLALDPSRVRARELAGEPILAILTRAPGNGAAIGGLKVVAANGWFAVRPSGTEAVSKLYAESFRGTDHLRAIQAQAQELLSDVSRP